MKLLMSILLLTLCTPALADPSPPAPLKIHVAIVDPKPSAVDVWVTRESPCSELNEDRGDRSLKLTACLKGEDLVIHWNTNSKAGGHHSSSALRVAPGARLELGASDGPHVIVTLP